MKYVVTTQCLENYGAHCESGRYADGNAYWKMKGGADYIVEGLERVQDAVAFVAAMCMQNNLSFKEFPVRFKEYAEWEADLPNDKGYRDYILSTAKRVSPEEVL